MAMGLSRYPSLYKIVRGARAALLRFPWVLASASLASASGVVLIEADFDVPSSVWTRLGVVALLGLPLFTALTTFAERQEWSALVRKLFPAVGGIFLAIYFFTLPDNLINPHIYIFRFFLLALGFHFLVAFLPFLRKDQLQGFWQYNKSLLVWFITAGVFSFILFSGLSIALASMDHLFGLDVDEKFYAYLWVIIAGVFNTWVFVSGIPGDLAALNNSDEYPASLKVLAQYILLPLVVLYFGILMAYEGKILATWNLPHGWVSQLVLWFSVVGILSLLLLHPLQKRKENKWISVFGRLFFRGLIPLVVMLFVAIYVRMADYGVTVNRYQVAAMSAGLAVVVLYFVFSKVRDIRIIPIVLFLLAMFSAYGPFSAFAVSERSQKARLEAYMTQYNILNDGAVRKAPEPVPYADRMEMSSIISYLCDWHGPQAYTEWFDNTQIVTWQDSMRTYKWRESVADQMGFQFESGWRLRADESDFHFRSTSRSSSADPITGYDYLADIRFFEKSDSQWTISMFDDTCYLIIHGETAELTLHLRDTSLTGEVPVRMSLSSFILDLNSEGNDREFPPGTLVVDAEGSSLKARFIFRHIGGHIDSGAVSVASLSGKLLVGKK